ncbi:MAG: hypothetical protein HY720_30610 [Planctomycetes bacterium]|nr:hypothetical protein [Planctomycetota bacterium]
MRIPVLVLVLAAALSSAQADVIYLKSGGTLEGKVLSQTEEEVVIELAHGMMAVPASNVLRIEKKPTPIDEYRERRAALDPSGAAACFDLARWCRAKNLNREYRECLTLTVEADPGHAEARRALGHIESDGRWYTKEQYEDFMTSRGFVRYEGRWVTKEEADTLARAAEAEKERQRLQTELNRLVRLLGHESKKVRDDAYHAILAMAEKHQIAGLVEAAGQARRYYEQVLAQRRSVTTEIHAQNAGPTEFRQLTTTLGGNLGAPVTIELPTHTYQGVDTTVQIPAGGSR